MEVTQHPTSLNKAEAEKGILEEHTVCCEEQPTKKKEKLAKTVNKKEIDEMGQKNKKEWKRNRERYEKLIALNPYFSMKLHSPHSDSSDQTSTMQKTLRHMDLLLDDGHFLQKQLKKSEFRRMQKDYVDPTILTDEWKHHYAHLRKIWLCPNDIQARGSLDKIEQLNVRVATIKNNIYSMTKHEKLCYGTRSQDERYDDVIKKINGLVSRTDQFLALKEKYENLQMKLQENQAKIYKMQESYERKLEEKNTVIYRLNDQNQEYKKALKESKEKQLANEFKQSKLQFRVKQLQTELKDRHKHPSTLTTCLSSTSIGVRQSSNRLHLLKQGNLDIGNIKFRKLQNDMKDMMWFKNQKVGKQKQKQSHYSDKHIINTTQDSSTNSIDQKERQSLPILKFPICNQNQITVNYSQLQVTYRSSQLSDAQSIDGKKNRFVRMRSPNNTKLMKGKSGDEEGANMARRASQCYSPRLKDLRQQGSLLVNP